MNERTNDWVNEWMNKHMEATGYIRLQDVTSTKQDQEGAFLSAAWQFFLPNKSPKYIRRYTSVLYLEPPEWSKMTVGDNWIPVKLDGSYCN